MKKVLSCLSAVSIICSAALPGCYGADQRGAAGSGHSFSSCDRFPNSAGTQIPIKMLPATQRANAANKLAANPHTGDQPTTKPLPAPASIKSRLVPPPPPPYNLDLKSLEPKEEKKAENPSAAASKRPVRIALPEIAGDNEYQLGPGDSLRLYDSTIPTKDETPYVSNVVIGPDGLVGVYPFGVLKAAGLTLRQFTQKLNERAGMLPNEPVSLVAVLAKPRPVRVYVLGDVFNPGVFAAKSEIPATASESAAPAGPGNIPQISLPTLSVGIGATYSAAEPPPHLTTFSVLTAIQAAGGVRDTADIFHVRLIRAQGRKQIPINLWRLLVEGDSSQDMVLSPGDTVFVPRGGPAFDTDVLGWAVRKPRPVRIVGSVNRPGLYYLGPDDDIATVLAKAGGFNSTAKRRYVILSRLNHDGTVTARAINMNALVRNRDKAAREPVHGGDIIVVQQSILRRTLPTIGYFGAILGTLTALRVINSLLPNTLVQYNVHPPPGTVSTANTNTSNTSLPSFLFGVGGGGGAGGTPTNAP